MITRIATAISLLLAFASSPAMQAQVEQTFEYGGVERTSDLLLLLSKYGEDCEE